MKLWDEENQDNLEGTGLPSLTLIRTANDCMDEAVNEPELKPLFGTLWQAGELTFLAGDTGKGKTILSVAIADALTKGKNLLLNQIIDYKGKVLYYDFELSDRQFRKRYKNYRFDGSFYRVVMNPLYLGTDLFSIETIETDLEATGAKVIIIDNITALALKSTQSQDEALSLMRGLKKLALQGISILVLAHTPKIAEGRKLSINHLAGSKHLSNFADSVFFIGQSNENPDYRYLKQVKCRNADQLHDVIVCELVNDQGYLSFEFVKYDREDTHIVQPVPVAGLEITQEMQKAFELHKQGKSLRSIAKELGVGKSTVDRWLKQRPVSQNEGNNDLKSMGQPEDRTGQQENINETAGQVMNRTESNSSEDISTEKKMKTETFEQGSGQKTEKGTMGQRDKQTNGTTGQEDKKELPPVTIEIVRNGKTITVHHPELKRLMYGDNWIDILYPENEKLEEEKKEQTKQKVKPVYGAYDRVKVEETNKKLRKWILQLFSFHRRSKIAIKVSEVKSLLEEISQVQNSFDYRYLPKDYEYFEFIETLKGKLSRAVARAESENLKKFRPQFEQSYILEMKQIFSEL